MSGRLEIILGCMYSGKSTELLRRCNRYASIGKKVLLINHALDTRTSDKIKTHQNVTQDAIKLENLFDIWKDENYLKKFKSADVIGIDESKQLDKFFNSLKKKLINTDLNYFKLNSIYTDPRKW